MPYSGFKPLVGGGPQHASAASGRPGLASATKTGLVPTAKAGDDGADPALAARSSTAALRSTFVDKEEAAMLRAMQRLNGDNAGKCAGNSFSATNRTKIKAQSEQAASMGLVPLDPHEQHEMHRKMEAGYTTISQRAVRVPRVGQGDRQLRARPAPIEYISHRKSEEEIRYETHNFAQPQAPVGHVVASSDEKREELAKRFEFNGRLPAEIVADGRAPLGKPRRPAGGGSVGGGSSEHSELRVQIETEVQERQEFLDNMRALGHGKEHEAVIHGEIRDRLADLKVLDRLEAQDGGSAGAGAS